MNDTETCSGGEFRPVRRPSEPFQIIPEELIAGGSREHVAIGNDRGGVTDGVSNRLLKRKRVETDR